MNEVDILALTYFDKATISGQVPYTKPNGATAFKSGIKVENISCAISKKDVANPNQTDTTNNIQYNSVLFCTPDTPIVSGDDVEVTFENGINRKYEAGEPFYYASHLEVPLLRKEKS
ncbi:ABC transporter ATP-binding protein [Clostridium tyrobutyricum]|uniref:ABC transporter ATP-binding protein n=1 Tax=Clostridium tyrobutyricum TaxID=1519 RepID=UPI002B202417|nr:ABC transporter ATP-binding protein [Clostridium tyrobutyricum]MEA5008234.1 ABC transporter ATP-binding protein [Clostridium tyrobutyricum]